MLHHKLTFICLFISLISVCLSFPTTIITTDIVGNQEEIENPEEIVMEITTTFHGGIKTKRQIRIGDGNNIEGILLNIGKIQVNAGGQSIDLQQLLQGRG